ncbi:MAG: hypothetical protein ACOX02_02700 [Acholeplasmatales bacterium]
MKVYHMIGINLLIDNKFDNFYKDSLEKYQTNKEPTHFIYTHLEIPKLNLEIIKQTKKKRFYEDKDYDYVLFVDDNEVPLNLIKRKKDFKKYEIYLNKNQKNLAGIEYTIHQMIFMEMALNCGFLPIHASAFEYKKKAVLITAPSGVGKSTLGRRMNSLYNLPIINDDKPLLRVENDCVLVYSSPFSGKESKNINTILPLGLIVFLERGNNKIKHIGAKEAINEISRNIFRPNELELWDIFADIANRTIKDNMLIKFEASNSDEAAEVLYEYLKEINL